MNTALSLAVSGASRRVFAAKNKKRVHAGCRCVSRFIFKLAYFTTHADNRHNVRGKSSIALKIGRSALHNIAGCKLLHFPPPARNDSTGSYDVPAIVRNVARDQRKLRRMNADNTVYLRMQIENCRKARIPVVHVASLHPRSEQTEQVFVVIYSHLQTSPGCSVPLGGSESFVSDNPITPDLHWQKKWQMNSRGVSRKQARAHGVELTSIDRVRCSVLHIY